MSQDAPTTVQDPDGASALRLRRRRERPEPLWHRAFPTWFAMVVAVYRSEPAVASDLSLSSAALTGHRHAVWAVSTLINGAAAAVVVSAAAARAGETLDASVGIPSLAAVAFLVTVFATLARVAAIRTTIAMRGKPVSFVDAAGLASVGLAASAPVAVVALQAVALPGHLTTLLLLAAGIFVAFVSESTVYIAVARYGRFVRSAAVPHAAFSAVWLSVVAVIVYLLAMDLVPGLFGTVQ